MNWVDGSVMLWDIPGTSAKAMLAPVPTRAGKVFPSANPVPSVLLKSKTKSSSSGRSW